MYDLKSFQRELTAFGGLNLRGEPNIRVVRGDQEMTFACGRMIPKYFVPGGARKDVTVKFRLRDMFTNEIKDCTREEAKDAWERSMLVDVTNRYIPETCRTTKITVTHRDGYFVEQYIPPEKIKDTPKTWEANRYAMWFDEELGKEVVTDMVGPFPSQGRYEFFVGGEELNEELLLKVRRALSRRDEWKQTKSNQLMVKDAFEAAAQKEVEAEAEVTEMLKSEFAPHAFRGLYLSGGKPNDKGSKEFFGRG